MPNTENIGLDKLVEMDRGFIQIDPYGRTKSKGLWAIGDCTPGPWLAHKASHEGVTAAEAIAQELGNKDVHPHPLDRNNIPGCTYCHPQIASVGMTEAKAKEAGYEVKVGNFPFIGNGKAIALGEAEGFIKTVFDAKTGELLGAHMVGAEVTEMIQGYVVGKTLETTEAELMQTDLPASDDLRNRCTKACSAPTGGRCISEPTHLTVQSATNRLSQMPENIHLSRVLMWRGECHGIRNFRSAAGKLPSRTHRIATGADRAGCRPFTGRDGNCPDRRS